MKARRRPRSRGYTLTELLVSLGISAVTLAMLWQIFGAGTTTTRRVLETLDAQQALRVRFEQLYHEIRSARSLLFPTPGARTQEGVGWIDREGKPWMVFLAREQGEGVLYRVDLEEKTKEILARDVSAFRCTIPAAPEGHLPGRVNLVLGFGQEARAGDLQRPRGFRMLTTVALRNGGGYYPH